MHVCGRLQQHCAALRRQVGLPHAYRATTSCYSNQRDLTTACLFARQYHPTSQRTHRPAQTYADRRVQTDRIRSMQRQAHLVYRPFSTSSAALAKSTPDANGVVDYLLADVGEGITECEIVKWFVEPGSHVEEFDVLVEVQSDKASVEITSRYTGTVKEHCYQVGQVARVGSPLCRIAVQGLGASASGEAELESSESSASPAQEPEPSTVQGDAQQNAPSKPTATPSDDASTAKSERHRTLATPAVRRLTREKDVNIADVRGTGRDGRVTKEDVQTFLAGGGKTPSAEYEPSSPSPTVPSSSAAATVTTTTVPLTGVRKAMFKAMSSTWTAPHFGYSDEVDVTKLEAIRKELAQGPSAVPAAMADDTGATKLTLLPFLVKALSLALHAHPLFRSTLDATSMQLSQTDAHRLSIALASSKGLVTPTLDGDVRSLSVLDIARQVAALQQNGAARGLSAAELGTGATLTLSNIGSVGGTHTFPLIPPTGQLAIGAVGRTRVLPRFDEHGAVVRASILPVSFSADHRVVEGVELARFVDDWKRLLENPTSWLLGMR